MVPILRVFEAVDEATNEAVGEAVFWSFRWPGSLGAVCFATMCAELPHFENAWADLSPLHILAHSAGASTSCAGA